MKIYFNDKIHTASGSYILIKLIEKDGELCRGNIFMTNKKYKFDAYDEVIYHVNDAKEVKINDDIIHIVLHYHILIKESLSKKMEELSMKKIHDCDEKPNMTMNFKMLADF